ncbi:MAG: efflux RND transporter periplasmic adaptor subunit [Pseudomonadota bacterium]
MAEDKKPSVMRRIARRVGIILGTVAVVGLAGLGIVAGSDFLAARAEATPPAAGAAATPVAVTPLRIENSYRVPRQFVGQIEAASTSVLSFELGGRVTQVAVEEGDTVSAGQEIARLDTALLEAEKTRLQASRAATQAQLTFAKTRVARAEQLRGQGFSSQETLDETTATRDELTSRIAEIDAALETVTINLEKSVLYAPFAGRIGAHNIDGGETLAAGQAVVTLIETSAPQVRIGLPLSFTKDMLDGAEIAIAGARYPADFIQFRPDIDPVTRTRTALFTLATTDAPTFGQTATLFVQTVIEARGAWVPLDALQEGSGSAWTVLVVEDDIVRTAAVELLHAEATRAYVRGTFEDGAQLIATGAHRVVPGQSVQLQQVKG